MLTIYLSTTGTVSHEQGGLVKGLPASLRKSVSFTPDTKVEDGYSASNFFKAWAAEQKTGATEEATDQPSSPSKVAKEPNKEKKKKPQKSKSTTLDTKTDSEPAKATKKDKNAKKERKEATEEKEPKETPQYVLYLQQYHTDKNNWKFNKNSQKDLFKNLFNVYRIPPQHDQAILQYIKGLQGAAARDRIAQDAEDVLKEIWVAQNPGDDSMSLESATARRVAYYRALEKHVERYSTLGHPASEPVDQEIEDIRRQVERGKRAEAILKDGLATPLSLDAQIAPPSLPAAIDSSIEKTKIQTPKGKRKRKARTEVSSSSSDDSSSSESDSESD